MIYIDSSIRYLWESLSNHTEEDDMSLQIYKKIEQNNYETEEAFIEDLEEEEILYLDALLKKEIKYAAQAQDDKRKKELNEIYVLLF
ncbi:sporulation protein [Virgibacillus sp. W0430]